MRNVKSFDIIKNNDYKIELIETCNIKTKQELFARERYYIENNDCINKNIPGRTLKQYRIDNKEKINMKEREYRDTNKDKITIKQREYYNDNKEKFKAYYETNKEANRDKVNEKFECECGGNFTYKHKSDHIKTAKHLNFYNL